MSASRFDDSARTTITGWLQQENVDASYLQFVLQHVDQPDDTWRGCCGSHCDPCVQRLGRVVDRARLLRPR